MMISANERHVREGNSRVGRSGEMPKPVRYAVVTALIGIVFGALYLLAVRGDALLSDLAGIVALICG